MPSASEFSTNPDSNTTIGGLFVGEECSPAVLNNVLRYLAAVARDSYDRIPASGSYLPIAGGTLQGDIQRQGRGGYLHFSGSSLTNAQVFALPEGSARPAAAEGILVLYYN